MSNNECRRMKVNDIDFSFSVRYSLFDILRFALDLVHTDAQLKKRDFASGRERHGYYIIRIPWNRQPLKCPFFSKPLSKQPLRQGSHKRGTNRTCTVQTITVSKKGASSPLLFEETIPLVNAQPHVDILFTQG
jgi:hypothetical protein